MAAQTPEVWNSRLLFLPRLGICMVSPDIPRYPEAFYLQEKEYRRRVKALLDRAFADPKPAGAEPGP